MMREMQQVAAIQRQLEEYHVTARIIGISAERAGDILQQEMRAAEARTDRTSQDALERASRRLAEERYAEG